MSRRRVATLLASGVVATLVAGAPGSSGSVSAGDDAATVNGESISVEDFEAVMGALGEYRPDLAPNASTDTVGADQGRQLLQIMILNRLRPAFLAEHDVEVSDAEFADAGASIGQQQGATPLPEPLQKQSC